MTSATVISLRNKGPIIGMHGDHTPAHLMFSHAMRRDDGSIFIPSKAPFKRSAIRNLVGAIIARIAR